MSVYAMVNEGRPTVLGDGKEENGVMNTRLGNNLYIAGIAGAVLSLLYAVDAVWVHGSGQSLLPISGRYVSREEMHIAITIGVALALLSWGVGAAARYLLNRPAQKQTGADDPRD